jgi:hypothetical protein
MEAQAATKTVQIQVNGKPVTLPEDKTTGRAIKDAAIKQGVQIRIDFNLFRIEGNSQHPVGDNQQVTVHNDERFRAVAPDDNSWR